MQETRDRGWCPGMTPSDGTGREGQDGEHMFTRGWFRSIERKKHVSL